MWPFIAFVGSFNKRLSQTQALSIQLETRERILLSWKPRSIVCFEPSSA